MDGTDYEALKFWVDVAWKAGTVICLLWLILRRSSTANSKRLDDHGDRLAAHDLELIVIKAEVEKGPTHNDVQLVHDRTSKVGELVSQTREAVAQLDGHIKGIRGAVDRIQDYLMKEKE